jgi:CheY-like chemotaxis protein
MELFNQPARDCSHLGLPLPKMRLVVVDDNQSSSQMLKRILEISHHQVWVAATGLEGIDLILREKPDLAFIDISLPDISGYEVAKRVKESLAAPPTSPSRSTTKSSPNFCRLPHPDCSRSRLKT